MGLQMRPYFHFLDGIRFGSAVSVMFFHLAFYSWASSSSTTAHIFARADHFEELAPWAWFGWVGVQLFFVISGFVIANSANGSSPIEFLNGRATRLYPAVLICAPISFLALLVIAGDPLAALIRPFADSILLIPKGPWIDGVYWSLAVEIIFYAIIFFVLVARKFTSLPLIAWALTIWSGSYLISVLVVSQTVEPEGVWWKVLSRDSEILLLRHGCFFAVGIWLWIASQGLLERSGKVGLAAATALGCIEIALRAREMLALEVPGWALRQPLFVPVAVWLVGISVIFLITSFPSSFTPSSNRVRTVLKLLGAMTYPLFLLHNVAGAGLVRLLISYGVVAKVALVTSMAAALTLSYLICRYWEPQARRSLQRGLKNFEAVLIPRVPRAGFLLVPGGIIVGPGNAATTAASDYSAWR